MIVSRIYMWLYNIVLHIVVFVAGIYFALKYRDGLSERMGRVEILPKKAKRIWVHAVSVGEVVAASSFIDVLCEHGWNGDIVFSTTTSTGMKTAKTLNPPVSHIFYYPIDLPFVVKRVVRRVNADLMVFVETELWPNMILNSFRFGVKLVLVNGRVSNGSFCRYRKIRPLMRYILSVFSVLCMVSGRDAEKIVELGADRGRVCVVGNIKHRATMTRKKDVDVSAVASWLNLSMDELLFVAGSTHRGEEQIVVDVFKKLRLRFSDLVLVLVPRHPERAGEVVELAKKYGLKSAKRSEIARRDKDIECIVVDTIGELFGIYSAATVVFCGGSLVPKGGQNIVEPAVWGKPVLYGPYMDDFQNEVEALTGKGGFQVKDAQEMFVVLEKLLKDEEFRESCGKMAMETVGRLSAGLDGCIGRILKIVEKEEI